MRAVALSDAQVQAKIAASFIPLKVTILPGTKDFPLDWPAMSGARTAYWFTGAEKCTGLTGCSVVGPDLKIEYGNTGNVSVTELFDSIAYDAQKFAAMLDRAKQRYDGERAIRNDTTLSESMRDHEIARYRREVKAAVSKDSPFHLLPPKGFSIENGLELFRISGDWPKK